MFFWLDPRNFHVTIKGVCFDRDGAVLMLREPSGVLDLPGGRLEHGEDFHTALRRECREEMSLDCEILDAEPYWSWSVRDRDGIWKVVLCFRIRLDSLAFTPSNECAGLAFFDADALAGALVVPQMRPLIERLRQRLRG